MEYTPNFPLSTFVRVSFYWLLSLEIKKDKMFEGKKEIKCRSGGSDVYHITKWPMKIFSIHYWLEKT